MHADEEPTRNLEHSVHPLPTRCPQPTPNPYTTMSCIASTRHNKRQRFLTPSPARSDKALPCREGLFPQARGFVSHPCVSVVASSSDGRAKNTIALHLTATRPCGIILWKAVTDAGGVGAPPPLAGAAWVGAFLQGLGAVRIAIASCYVKRAKAGPRQARDVWRWGRAVGDVPQCGPRTQSGRRMSNAEYPWYHWRT